jgi:hypothetical protein
MKIKTIKGLGLMVCLLIGLFSCNKLLPINYDKAGRDVMAIMQDNPSLTVEEFKNELNESGIEGMSSKDFITMSKTEEDVNEYIKYFSLDIVKDKIKEFDVDLENLKRALEE